MNLNKLTFILVIVFGSSSWIGINSIWMELPFLVSKLPEEWVLPATFTIIIQIACIGLFFYTVLNKCFKIKFSQVHTIFFLLFFCSAFTLLLSFFWEKTVFLDKERSLAILILTFFIAFINSTSNVLYMPYIASFYPSYLIAYFVGMGFSALIPSVLALIQGTSKYECVENTKYKIKVPKFSPNFFNVDTYFLIIFIWSCLATVSFVALNNFLKNEKIENKNNKMEPLQELIKDNELTQNQKNFRYTILTILLSFVCAQMNSIVPSIQNFATIPYSYNVYYLSLTLTNLIQPVTSFLPFWIKFKKLKYICIITCFATFFTAVIVFLALQSPNPPLKNHSLGSFISIFCSIISGLLCAYLRTLITTVIKEDSPENKSRVFWCGFSMQFGSFLGACLMYLLVNYIKIFKEANMCL